MKKLSLSIFTVVSIMLASCGSGSSSSGGSSSSTTSLGELPNGSQVMLTKSNAEITPTTPQVATISLVGGTANTKYSMALSTESIESSLLASLTSAESDGITITPALCEVGTNGSGQSSSCQVTITTSANTTNGTHYIYTTAIPSQDPVSVTKLTPFTIVISGGANPSPTPTPTPTPRALAQVQNQLQ